MPRSTPTTAPCGAVRSATSFLNLSSLSCKSGGPENGTALSRPSTVQTDRPEERSDTSRPRLPPWSTTACALNTQGLLALTLLERMAAYFEATCRMQDTATWAERPH